MTPWEGKGQCQKGKRADGTGRGCGVEAEGSWGCRRRRRCPRKEIGESQVPGSPREEPPAHALAGPLCLQRAPLGRTSHAPRLLLGAEASLVHQIS